MGVTQAWAQKALPYSYDFSTDLTTEGWTKTNCHTSSAVSEGAFRFYFNTNPPQYLISPELSVSTNSISVSFEYKAYSTSYEESFKVGYSTTDNNPESFTWDEEVKTNITTYLTYEHEFPSGVKYIAIAYTANDKYYLYIDNFKVDPVIVGPGFAVEGYASGSTFDFGLAEAGATKTFNLLNPGTEPVTVGIAATGGFSVSSSSVTIAAKGSETVTITMPNADATGTLAFSPEGLENVTLNLSCYVFDSANKFFEDFESLTATNVSPYTLDKSELEAKGWIVDDGWKIYNSNNNKVVYRDKDTNTGSVILPKMTVAGENERFWFTAYNLYTTDKDGVISISYAASADATTWSPISNPYMGNYPAGSLGNALDTYYYFNGIPAGDWYIKLTVTNAAFGEVYGFTEANVEPSAVIANVMLPGEFNGWQGAQNELTYDATAKAYKGVLDLSNTTADQQFKVLVRAEGYDKDIYLGWQQKDNALTIDAPEGWVVDYSNDNLYLLNSTTNYKTYDVTVKWQASADATTGWTLTIAGKDERYNTYTATFADNAGWGNIHAYTWTGEGSEKIEQLGAWPGKKLELNADGKYEVKVLADDAPAFIIFHNTSGTQTDNLEFINGNEYNNAVLTSFAATFVNAAGWDNVYAYVWSGEGSSATNKVLGDWPGTKLTAGADGKFAVSFDAIEAPEKIIFNNGNNGKQTGNLAFVDAKEYELFYEGFTHVDGVVQDGDLEGWTVDAAHDYASSWYGTVQYYNNAIYYYLVLDNMYPSGESTDEAGYVITPKLHVEGTDDRMSFKAYHNNGTLKVQYSSDKQIWSDINYVGTVGTSFSDIYINGIPEGDWYIKFILQNICIDEVYGFTLAADTKTLALDEASTENQIVAGTYDEVTIARTVLAGPNPMCLPFAVTKEVFEANFGEGSTVLEFGAYENGAINLTKKEIADVAMEANVPYIVYAKQAATELSFNNVEVNANEAGTVIKGDAQFIGTFVKKALNAEGDNKPYAVSKTGTINPVKAGANLKGFRAYFMLPANTTAKVFIDGVAVDGEATGIEAIENAQEGVLYDLSGRRVNNAQKGIYIQNGKKFVVK